MKEEQPPTISNLESVEELIREVDDCVGMETPTYCINIFNKLTDRLTSLQAEKENYKNELADTIIDLNNRKNVIKELQAENERLKKAWDSSHLQALQNGQKEEEDS